MTAATTAQLSRAALNDYIENHLANAARPLSLAEVFRDVYPGQRATDCALLALRKRLQYLAAEGRLQSDGYGDGRTWSGITEAQRAEQAAHEAAHQAAQAARVALNQLAAVEPRLHDFLHPAATVQHAVHVHHLSHAADFRPAEHGFHFRSGKISAGHLQPRR